MRFVFLSEYLWDAQPEIAAKKLALTISEQFPVIFINPPQYRSKKRNYFQSKSAGPNLHIYTPTSHMPFLSMLPGWMFAKIQSYFTNKKLAIFIAEITNPSSSNPAVLINNSLWASELNLVNALKPRAYVFLFNNTLTTNLYSSKKKEKQLAASCRTADLVVASCNYLRNHAAHYTSKAFTLYEGNCYPLLKKREQATSFTDVKRVDTPVVAYLGPLNKELVDIDMLKRICQRTPNYQYKLLLPYSFRKEEIELENMPNVKVIFFNKELNLGTHLEQVDVALYPLAGTHASLSRFPNEIFSFMMLKKPVVINRTINTKPFETYVRLAYGDNDILSALKEVLEHPDQQTLSEAQTFATNISWEGAVIKLYQLIYNSTGEVIIPQATRK